MAERTLSGRLMFANGMLILAIIMVSAAAVVGLFALKGSIELAVDEYEEAQLLDSAASEIARARLKLRLGDAEHVVIESQLGKARRSMAQFMEYQAGEIGIEEEHQEREFENAREILNRIDMAIAELEQLHVNPEHVETAFERIASNLQSTSASFKELAGETDVSSVREAATRQAALTVLIIAGLGLLIVTAAILISVRTHRQIAGALERLQTGVRRVASGRFTERVEENGDAEIVALAREFNQMAVDLDSFYREMEERVQEKSRELVRSERLASVGFLAAGVAHEINNPLGIISGYAELARKWIAVNPGELQLRESRDALDTIRDEAFRCKMIVEQLMTLTRSGDDSRNEIALDELVGDVISLVRGLQKTGSRKVTFKKTDAPTQLVFGNAVELKQVVLNLLVNALQATDPSKGVVSVSLDPAEKHVRLIVEDNGCGLEPETIDKIFEPFFSHRPRATQEDGLGLGLTISHAIVEAHGGQLCVESDGRGYGSRFIVQIPTLSNREHNSVGS